MRNECVCVLEETCHVSDREQSFHTTYPGLTAAPVLAGTPQPSADIDSALLKTLQHLHRLLLSVLLKIFQLLAEPVGFWLETCLPKRLSRFDWQDGSAHSGRGKET